MSGERSIWNLEGPVWCACRRYGDVHVWEPGGSCNSALVEPIRPSLDGEE